MMERVLAATGQVLLPAGAGAGAGAGAAAGAEGSGRGRSRQAGRQVRYEAKSD